MLEVYGVKYLKTDNSKCFKNHFKSTKKASNEINIPDIVTGLNPLQISDVYMNTNETPHYYKFKVKENCELKLKLICEYGREKHHDYDDTYPILTISKIEGIIDGEEVKISDAEPMYEFHNDRRQKVSGYEIHPFHTKDVNPAFIKNCGLFKHIEIKNDTIHLNGFVDLNLIISLSLKKIIDVLPLINKTTSEYDWATDEEIFEEIKKFRGILNFEIEHNNITLNDFHNSSRLLFNVDNVEYLGENKFELSIHNHSEINIIKHAEYIRMPGKINEEDNEDDNKIDSNIKKYFYNRKILKTKESTYEIKKFNIYETLDDIIFFNNKNDFPEGLYDLYPLILKKLFNNNPIEYKNFLNYFNERKYIYDRHYQLYDTDENIKKIFKASSIYFKMIEIGIQIHEKNIKLLEDMLSGKNHNNIGKFEATRLKIGLKMNLNSLTEIYKNLLNDRVGFESIITPYNDGGNTNIISENETGVTVIRKIKYNVIKIKKL